MNNQAFIEHYKKGNSNTVLVKYIQLLEKINEYQTEVIKKSNSEGKEQLIVELKQLRDFLNSENDDTEEENVVSFIKNRVASGLKFYKISEDCRVALLTKICMLKSLYESKKKSYFDFEDFDSETVQNYSEIASLVDSLGNLYDDILKMDNYRIELVDELLSILQHSEFKDEIQDIVKANEE